MRVAPVTLTCLLFGAVSADANVVGARAPNPAGTLTLLEDEPFFTFNYSTPDPDPQNWIGIYHASGGGPVDEKPHLAALVWAWATKTQGTLQIPTTKLTPGEYQAFFLAKNKYNWLAQPIFITLPSPQTPVTPAVFVVNQTTLHNARQGDLFEARIGGLVTGGAENTTVSFKKIAAAGDDWVTVSADGKLSGTPSHETQNTNLTVVASASDGNVSRLQVTIPVRPFGRPLVRELKVITNNLWVGGTHMTDYHNKQVRFYINQNVDIVTLQECTGVAATQLAETLGWYAWQEEDNVGVISRYPIVETNATNNDWAGHVRVALDGEDSQVNIWTLHVASRPYGPYQFCYDKMSVSDVVQSELDSDRNPQLTATLKSMKGNLEHASDIPVILTGDFNAPSHLDYVEGLREKNCGVANVPWPTSMKVTEAGMIDSFRVAHPDPVKEQGITWSPIYLMHGTRPEPLDRIDFIYYKGNLTVKDSQVLVAGNPTPEPDHENNEWTSDHAAVVTTFKVPVKGCISRRRM